MKEIREFTGEYAYMDNDYTAPIKIGNEVYQCSEAAYQAERMSEQSMRHKFCGLSGKEAKAIGMFMTERDNWDKIRKDKLFWLTMEKYKQNPQLAEKLLETTNIPITHPFLGDTLMRVRDLLGSNKYEVNYGSI